MRDTTQNGNSHLGPFVSDSQNHVDTMKTIDKQATQCTTDLPICSGSASSQSRSRPISIPDLHPELSLSSGDGSSCSILNSLVGGDTSSGCPEADNGYFTGDDIIVRDSGSPARYHGNQTSVAGSTPV